MFKILCFLKSPDGLSREAMRRHYEDVHVPLARATFPQILEHRRNWIDADSALFPPGHAVPPYDCVSEIWFESRATYEQMLAMLADPDQAVAVKADEANFLDPARCGMVIVDETIGHGQRA